MNDITKQQPLRAASAAFFGTALEWYDFFCYATASALVFGNVFFPPGNQLSGTLASLGTFAVGFVARPFGAILFGHFGDKAGRRASLIVTLLLMGCSTTLIGLLPSYQAIGIYATVLLVLLRILQGVAVGGEWGGAVLIATEHAPPRWRTFLAAAPQYGSPVGLIMATSIFHWVSALPEGDFRSWGWRIPFLASALIVLVALLIRRGVEETPELQAYRAKQAKTSAAPLKTLFTSYKRRLVLGIALSVLGISGFYFFTTLMIAFTTTYLHIAKPDILKIINYIGVVGLLSYPIASFLAHRLGERRFILVVSAAAALWSVPMMLLVLSRDLGNIAIGILAATALISFYYAALASFLPKVFPVNVRYSGISLSYQISGAVFGGTTPLVGLWVAQRYGAQWGPLALMFATIAGVTFIAALLLPDGQADTVAEGKEQAHLSTQTWPNKASSQ
jgi:MFS family permease